MVPTTTTTFPAPSITGTNGYKLKRAMKLCNNQYNKEQGQDSCNPAYNYIKLCNTIVHNANVLTKHAELGQSGNKTIWDHGGYGEAGSRLLT